VKNANRTPPVVTLLPRPTPGQIAATLLAVAIGGVILMVPGAVLGLCLGVIIWTAGAIQDDL